MVRVMKSMVVELSSLVKLYRLEILNLLVLHLATLFASANKVTLSDNVAISSNISIADGKEFDGAGNTLFMDNMTETGGLALGLTVAGGEIKNLNIDGQNQASVNNKGYPDSI